MSPQKGDLAGRTMKREAIDQSELASKKLKIGFRAPWRPKKLKWVRGSIWATQSALIIVIGTLFYILKAPDFPLFPEGFSKKRLINSALNFKDFQPKKGPFPGIWKESTRRKNCSMWNKTLGLDKEKTTFIRFKAGVLKVGQWDVDKSLEFSPVFPPWQNNAIAGG